jgi:curved DNA-binding protein CbpA
VLVIGAELLSGVQRKVLSPRWQVLRDTGRRAQYDAARSATAAGPRGFPGGVYQPGVSDDAFEAAFRRWWEKAGAE